MSVAIRKHLRDFVAVLGLILVSVIVIVVILDNSA